MRLYVRVTDTSGKSDPYVRIRLYILNEVIILDTHARIDLVPQVRIADRCRR